LLPWDQKGYWATRVATNLLSLVPVVGKGLQAIVVGGPDYGHHTLTRFFALHAGVLPALLVAFLALHVALFRRHGICHKEPAKRPETTFWPDQVLRDAVACFAVLAIVLLLAIHFNVPGLVRGTLSPEHAGAELGAPADSSLPYSAARPEWYFLFLFQFLKLFEGGGESGERLGAIVLPGVAMLILFLMPLVGRWKWGHRWNIAFLLATLLGIGALTGAAIWEDQRARWTDGAQFKEIADQAAELGHDEQKIAAHFAGDATKIADYRRRLAQYEAYRKSADFIAAVKSAEQQAQRVFQLAAGPNRIPPEGAISLVRSDPETQGPRLFAQYCASCHSYFDPAQIDAPEAKDLLAKASASNLFAFASRPWIAGLLNPKKIAGPEYFGLTTKFKELKAKGKSMEMVDYVQGDLHDWPKEEVDQVVDALAAQANLPAEATTNSKEAPLINSGRKLLADDSRCAACHRFQPDWPPGDPKLLENETGYPDLTRYGSRDWLIGMISNPGAPRFYGKKNDRMPAFAVDAADASKCILTRREIELIVDWLRGDYLRGEEGR
jgi:ubiquinol-cytochrome c reductase cytochrome b subunit